MSRARWYVIAALSLVTVVVVVLDATGVIFGSGRPVPEPLVVTVPAPAPVADVLGPTVDTPPADTGRLARGVQKALSDSALGPRVTAMVTSASGDVVVDMHAGDAGAPASTLKLLTGLAALDQLGPDAALTTSVVSGDSNADLVLVGAGDSTLVTRTPRGDDPPAASLQSLARLTASALRSQGVDHVRLGYDASLFTGPEVAPSWPATYVESGVVAPVSSLMVDDGLVDPESGSLAREADPAKAAAESFAGLLRARGIRVAQTVTKAAATPSAAVVAQVSSPPVSTLVERMLTESDNQLAESLGRLVAVAHGDEASFSGAAVAVTDVARSYGIDLDGAKLLDSSGLSRADRVPAAALNGVLVRAVADPLLRPLTLGLPVAGLTGTLADRFLVAPAAAGAGVVRAKTGTLTGISAEAGLVVGCGGHLFTYAFLADRVPFDTDAARTALDDAAASLTTC